jgi:hypothetical protein
MSQLRVSSVTDISGTGSTYAPGHIIQVVSVTKTDVFTTTNTTFTDITGLSLLITPKSTSSKILITGLLSVNGLSANNAALPRLLRDSTQIAIPDAAGSRERVLAMMEGINSTTTFVPINYLDSPNTLSEVSYKMQVRSNVSGQTAYINRTIADVDSILWSRAVSTITAMEIAQ